MKLELCCIGHITLDKIVTPKSTVHMPGGTSFYVSSAICGLKNIRYGLITAVGAPEMTVVEELRAKGVQVVAYPSPHSVCFENIYGEDQNHRRQRVQAKAHPFTLEQVREAEADIFHLGALLADDFSPDVVKYLAGKGLVSVDSQGYLREVRDTQVYAIDWKEKRDVLKYVHFLKANEQEMEALTGYTDVAPAAGQLHAWGVREVLITLGDAGSVIYDGTSFFRIPAYKPREVVDATGCGDTYMAGYLYQRARGVGIEESGRFAAALSTLKIERSGPVQATGEDVSRCMQFNEQSVPDIDLKPASV
ncbi:MAG: PfkB family carbohydrate kinase [Tannerella sp.]|jgi:sugar/nucleoside kinase (ribokinase family)|nr:PfkB family carbohydrate kinase [Tannerella sp.]